MKRNWMDREDWTRLFDFVLGLALGASAHAAYLDLLKP